MKLLLRSGNAQPTMTDRTGNSCTVFAEESHGNISLNRHLRVPIFVAVLLILGLAATIQGQTALDTYVAQYDPTYKINTSTSEYSSTGKYTLFTVEMTSQTWRDPSEVNHNAWQHIMKICVPDVVTSDKALLYIHGGTHGSIPSIDTSLAVSTKSVVASIANIPNQKLQFAGESFEREEDSLLAKTIRLAMENDDDEWLGLLPMVKSAVRAMDTVQTITKNPNQTNKVNEFVVTGISKRGWTTWLTAAVDDRVCGIVPSMINVLNMDEQMKHHNRYYEGNTWFTTGGYSDAIKDYVNEGNFDDMDSPEFQHLLTVADPYEYRDRLDIPKLLINSTGDEFFVPDSCQFFFDDLPGENYIRYQPNIGHNVGTSGDSDGYTTLTQFYKAILEDTELPEFSWTVEADGSIHVTTEDEPLLVKLWQATNPDDRDFRWGYTGIPWYDSILDETTPGSGEYIASLPAPASGATGFMIELTYLVDGEPMKFTTEVSVLPQATPEPATLFLTAMGGLALLRRRR